MHAEWQVECGADDPVVVVPWSGPDTSFVDLRTHPHAIDEIPEAEAHPPLMQALRALNAGRSPIFTAKCDAWALSEDEVAQLRLDLALEVVDAHEEDAAENDSAALKSGFGSYIDFICRDRALFASFARQEHLLRSVTRLALPLDHHRTALDCVLRPAFVSLQGAQEGFAVSLYVKALGESSRKAWSAWALAMSDVVDVLRRKEVFR
ncbi:MAG TPA: hypothetical protein VN678_08500 [Acidobacteriaceae bacterium]|nr:hypothetical protein [Acidobacteriaceae bacterium]